MKRIIIYIVVLALSMMVPEYRTDVGKLIPVELLFIYREDSITIETDAGNWGRGDTLKEAIADMKGSASGEIFLDTADYLLLDENSEDLMEEIAELLKGTVRVCFAPKGLDLQETARYLSIHKPEMRLEAAKMDAVTEIIEETEGKLKIVKKSVINA